MTDKAKMYAVKNDEGEWMSLDGTQTGIWYSNNPTLFKYKSYAEAQSMGLRAHVVELVEAPAKVVVPQWFDEWLDAFHYLDPQGRVVAPVGRIAQQGWGASANQPFLGRENLDGTATPRLTIPQTNYLYDHKKELMLVALTGDYTVEKPKRWNVKVPHVDAQEGLWFFVNSDGKVDATYDQDLAAQFTAAEIDQYGLQDCEKVEVRDED